MANNLSFTIIKPTAVQKNYTGSILAMITENGFKIKALRLTKMSKQDAQAFYAVHNERPFYDMLCEFMSSGPVVVALLEKENAVEEFRKLIGATNPDNAEKGTIRERFGTTLQANAIHGSDSDENALNEAAHFFSDFDRY